MNDFLQTELGFSSYSMGLDVKMYLHLLLWMLPLVFGISVGANTNVSSSYLIPCRQGWFHFDKKCYKILGESSGLNWKQASVKCSLERGHLATVDSPELQEFLTTFLLLNAQTNAWIGLHDREKETEFTWDDGSDLNYTRWDENQPSRKGGRNEEEDCVEMRFENFRSAVGTWNDESCDTKRPYICQLNETADAFSADPRFCSIEEGEGWKYLNSCYHVVTQKMTWEEAENYCGDIYSGHLVSILNDKADKFLDYLMTNYTEEFWIGSKLQDQVLQLWTSGWHMNYKNWDHEQEEFLAETCGVTSRKGSWTVRPCFHELPFICEISKDEAPVLKKAPKGWECPDSSKGWIDLGGESCYFFETSKTITWYQANYDCGRRGGLLASIHSEAETNILHPHVTKANERVFIGLHRSLSKKSEFEWADGSNLDYLNWDSGEPNNIREECGEVWIDSMRWNDVPCDTLKGYICAAKKVPSNMTSISSAESRDEASQTLQSSTTETNVSEPIGFSSPSASDMAGISSAASKDHVCPRGLSAKSVVGIVICILLLTLLTGVAVYYSRNVCKRQRNNFIREDLSYDGPPSLCHISSEVILKPEELECRM